MALMNPYRSHEGARTLACVLLLVASASVSWADEGPLSPEVFRLDEVVVTATRAEEPVEETTSNVTVITRSDMDKLPASSVSEALRYVPGVYVEFNGGLGSVATGQIQGSEVRQVAVYQDGVPLNQLANPLTDLSYLPLAHVERIEIYKGSASSSWGSALGGVINIITKEPDPEKPLTVDAKASYGDFKTLRSSGAASGTVDRFGYLLSGVHEESNGFIQHTAYEQDAFYGKLDHPVGEASRLNFAYNYDVGRNEDPVVSFPDFWDELYRRRTYERLLFETSPAADMALTIEGRHHRFYNWIDDVFIDHREIFSDYLEETYGMSTRVDYDALPSHHLVAGFDEDWGEYDWSNYQRAFETRNWAVYGNDTFTWDDLTLTGGLRYDDNMFFGGEFSPSAGTVYRLAEGKALVRGQVARGFSAPPAAWVQDPQFGNPDLGPETAVNYQAGFEVRPFESLQLEANYFLAEIDDFILFNMDTNKFENIDAVTRQGVEGAITRTFDVGLRLSLGGTYVDVRNDNTGDVIENIPRTQYNVSASYTREWMTHALTGSYIDNNSSFPETRDQVFIFDYRLDVKVPVPDPYGDVTLFGAVHNLTNTTYLFREVFPQPGRWFEGGVRFQF